MSVVSLSGQGAKLVVLVRSELDLRLRGGEVRQHRVDRNVSEVVEVGKGLEVTVKEQQEQTTAEETCEERK